MDIVSVDVVLHIGYSFAYDLEGLGGVLALECGEDLCE